jgi:hypothetical protein
MGDQLHQSEDIPTRLNHIQSLGRVQGRNYNRYPTRGRASFFLPVAPVPNVELVLLSLVMAHYFAKLDAKHDVVVTLVL